MASTRRVNVTTVVPCLFRAKLSTDHRCQPGLYKEVPRKPSKRGGSVALVYEYKRDEVKSGEHDSRNVQRCLSMYFTNHYIYTDSTFAQHYPTVQLSMTAATMPKMSAAELPILAGASLVGALVVEAVDVADEARELEVVLDIAPKVLAEARDDVSEALLKVVLRAMVVPVP